MNETSDLNILSATDSVRVHSETLDKQVDYRIRVYTTFEDLEEILPYWKAWFAHPNADPELFRNTFIYRPEFLNPYILALFKGDEPIALWLARIEEVQEQAPIGYLKFHLPRARKLQFIYGGLLGMADPEITIQFLRVLAKHQQAGVFDFVAFIHIRTDEAYLQPLMSSDYFQPERRSRSYVHYFTVLPENFEKLLANMPVRRRQQMRRMRRKLDRVYEGRTELDVCTTYNQIGPVLPEIDALTARSYHRALGVGFANSKEIQERFKYSAENGWLRCYSLRIDGEMVVYNIGSLFRNVFYGHYTSFDRRYEPVMPGIYLLQFLFEDLCNLKIHAFDFGFGDSVYKRKFATQSWPETNLYLFPYGFKGSLFRNIMDFNDWLDDHARSLLQVLSIENKVKKKWREAVMTETAKEGR
jgi:hypothetical protein